MRRLVIALVLGLGLGVGASEAGAVPPEQRQQLTHRPSGFWTSNRPAQHGAYRWKLLGIGVVLAGGAGLLMITLVRRARAERAARTGELS